MSSARELLNKERRRVPPERFDAMLEMAAYGWSLRAQFEEVGIWHAEMPAEALTAREVADVPTGSIGNHLGVLVDQRRRAQRHRAVQDGDLADRNHVQFAPYVDVFTGDLEICTWLRDWRVKLPFQRQVQPVASRHLREVLALLEHR
jgi:hypothetical protein